MDPLVQKELNLMFNALRRPYSCLASGPDTRVVRLIHSAGLEPVRHCHLAMGYPFLDLPNVIGSPHNSAGTGRGVTNTSGARLQNRRRAILGETPRNFIGPDERML